jgi:hypothetical protein
MGLTFPRPGARLIRVLDAAVIVWVIGWVVLAVFVAREVRNLRDLSDTVVVAGQAVEDTGDLLKTLGTVPLIGGQVGDVADEVRAAGRSAQASGRDSRESTENLSILLALAIGLIPTLPLFALYAPLRISWTREALAVRRALASADAATLERYLAWRAVSTVPYDQLLQVSADPFHDLEEGRYEALAASELRRLGIRVAPSARTATLEP